jgi:hypothetical protein
MNNKQIEFINFPDNVQKFNGVITHTFNVGDTKLEMKQDNEKELKIKLKYLLAYKEALFKITNQITSVDKRSVTDELEYNFNMLLELFDPINDKVENFLDKPMMESKPLNLNAEETWNN